MNNYKIDAFYVTKELFLNHIASDLNIKKKFTWEEALVLKGAHLTGILNKGVRDDQKVLLYSFGSVVFINIEKNNYPLVLNYLKQFHKDINSLNYGQYYDSYELHANQVEAPTFDDEYMHVITFEDWMPEIISTVLAKSVAFEKIESDLEVILDKIEPTIDQLERGKYRMNSKKLARQIASVLRHDYNSLVYVMILDRPDITWGNSEAQEMYDHLSEFFELNDRHMIVKEKMETLNRIVDGFIEIAESHRAYILEMTIILLIAFEIVLSFFH